MRIRFIEDRETFTGLADTPEELKTIASDLVINLTDGGMPHKREYAKVLTAWKRTKAQVEVKTSTEALQRQHGEPVRMLPEDWTSVIVKVESKYADQSTGSQQFPDKTSYFCRSSSGDSRGKDAPGRYPWTRSCLNREAWRSGPAETTSALAVSGFFRSCSSASAWDDDLVTTAVLAWSIPAASFSWNFFRSMTSGRRAPGFL